MNWLPRWWFGWFTAALVGYVWAPAPAWADVVSLPTFFTADARSIWNGGPGFSLDTGDRFLGASWDLGNSAGTIKDVCIPFVGCASFGAEVGANTSGRAGIDYGLRVDSGTFNVQFPGVASIITPTSVIAGGPVTIGSTYSGVPSLDVPISAGGAPVARSPYLQVNGPTVQAHLDAGAQADAFAGAAVCVGVCYGPKLGPISFNEYPLNVAINRNGDGQVRFGDTVVSANQNVSELGGLVNFSLNLPNLDSNSNTTPGGSSPSMLVSRKEDRVAAVNANLAQIAANVVGVQLSGNYGPFGYNLLQANAGLAIDVAQTLTFTPNVTGKYLFSAPVMPEVGGKLLAPTNEIDFKFGDSVSFVPAQDPDNPGKVRQISIVPEIGFGASVHNETDLVLEGGGNVKALGVDIAGVTLGPLFDKNLGDSDLGTVDLCDSPFNLCTSLFDVSLGSVLAKPITLTFDCQGENIGTNEFPEYGVCASSGINDLTPFANPDGTFNDYLVGTACTAETRDSPPICGQTDFSAFTSSYLPSSSGGVFLNNPGSAFDFAPNSPGPSTTPEQQLATLAGLGFPTDQPFIIPQGASLQSFATAPEPNTLVLFSIGAGAVIFYRRGRKRAEFLTANQTLGRVLIKPRRCPLRSDTDGLVRPQQMTRWANSRHSGML